MVAYAAGKGLVLLDAQWTVDLSPVFVRLAFDDDSVPRFVEVIASQNPLFESSLVGDLGDVGAATVKRLNSMGQRVYLVWMQVLCSSAGQYRGYEIACADSIVEWTRGRDREDGLVQM